MGQVHELRRENFNGRSVKMISASSIERVMKCELSTLLPQVERDSADSLRGTVVHEFLRNVNAIGYVEALAKVPADYHETCANIDVDELPTCGASYAAEVAFILDTTTGKARVVGENIGRNYPAHGPLEIPGTADVVGVGDDFALIIDYKGRWSNATKASDNWQLRALAVMACRAYGKSRAIVGIYRVGETTWRDVAELSEMDIDIAEMELRDLMKRMATVTRETAKVAEGEHCRYCPAFDSCPAKQTLVRSFANVVESHAAVAIDTMDDDARLEVWNKIDALEDVLKRAKALMRESIERKPIRVGDRIIAMVEEERRSVNCEIAESVVEQMMGMDYAANVGERKTTLTRIGEVATEYAKANGQKAAALKKTVEAAILDKGGISVSKFSKVKELSASKIALQNS